MSGLGQWTCQAQGCGGLGSCCKACEGRGWLRPHERLCKTCNGRGDDLCPYCNGRGVYASQRRENVIVGYHQTSARNAIRILGNGFQPGREGMAGGGIYFALNPDDTYGKAHQLGPVLKADVDIGATKVLTERDPDMTLQQLNGEGFDSVFMPSGSGLVSRSEYVVYESERVRNVRRSSDQGSPNAARNNPNAAQAARNQNLALISQMQQTMHNLTTTIINNMA